MVQRPLIRISKELFNALRKNFYAGNPDDEKFAYFLCRRVQGQFSIIYHAVHLLLPEEGDLEVQSAAQISPTKEYQASVMLAAEMLNLSILEVHTHPFQERVRFSPIDNAESIKTARYIQKKFQAPVTMIMTVFNRELDCHDSRIWDRRLRQFVIIETIEVLGSSIEFIHRELPKPDKANQRFERMLRIPGWKQQIFGKLKVFVCGLGGNGAPVANGLLSIGVGKDTGCLMGFDPDELEESNLPRIPYASSRDVGSNKALLMQLFAHYKEPQTNVLFFPEGIESKKVQGVIKECHFIIGCVDHDYPRFILNKISMLYGIPFIDCAAEIIPGREGNDYEAGGQIKTVIPGKTACLVCANFLDMEAINHAMMSEEEKTEMARYGYVRGSDNTPTPSVLHLNGVTAGLVLSQVQRMVSGESIKGIEFIHYDRQDCSMFAASMPEPNPDCPICGELGILGMGDDEQKIPEPKKEVLLLEYKGEK